MEDINIFTIKTIVNYMGLLKLNFCSTIQVD